MCFDTSDEEPVIEVELMICWSLIVSLMNRTILKKQFNFIEKMDNLSNIWIQTKKKVEPGAPAVRFDRR
jgi:hypothetical protein